MFEKAGKFFYELACWAVIVAALVLFWMAFGPMQLDERGTDTYRGVDL